MDSLKPENQVSALKSFILKQNPPCPDAPQHLSDYCDMMHVCHVCKARMKAVKYVEETTGKNL
ncbi:hypothetical protein AD45P4_00350 [Alteromonas phage vB_AmaP_AD45-P4]|nr:hypothetical protein AD45P3_00355 [Alteromonas phage vB_AmaP_AD45-P3]AGM47125.1 hypothetical protein AD45P4_00350 [Alteromonas phage vB_AmaP_AD45-P4]